MFESNYFKLVLIITTTLLILLDLSVVTHQDNRTVMVRSKRRVPYMIFGNKKTTGPRRFNQFRVSPVPYFHLDDEPNGHENYLDDTQGGHDDHYYHEEPLPIPDDYYTHSEYTGDSDYGHDDYGSMISYDKGSHVVEDYPKGNHYDSALKPHPEAQRMSSPPQDLTTVDIIQPLVDELPAPSLPQLEVYQFAGSYRDGDQWPYIVYQPFDMPSEESYGKNDTHIGRHLGAAIKNFGKKIKKLFRLNRTESSIDVEKELHKTHPTLTSELSKNDQHQTSSIVDSRSVIPDHAIKYDRLSWPHARRMPRHLNYLPIT